MKEDPFQTRYPGYNVFDKWSSPDFDSKCGVSLEALHKSLDERSFAPRRYRCGKPLAYPRAPQTKTRLKNSIQEATYCSGHPSEDSLPNLARLESFTLNDSHTRADAIAQVFFSGLRLSRAFSSTAA